MNKNRVFGLFIIVGISLSLDAMMSRSGSIKNLRWVAHAQQGVMQAVMVNGQSGLCRTIKDEQIGWIDGKVCKYDFGKEQTAEYQMLIAPGILYEWTGVQKRFGQLEIPSNAVNNGSMKNQSVLCRVQKDGSFYPGIVVRGECLVTKMDDKEAQKNFEVLTIRTEA